MKSYSIGKESETDLRFYKFFLPIETSHKISKYNQHLLESFMLALANFSKYSIETNVAT